jgi:hypothetical protein
MSELDEFEAYIAELATALGHADREVPFRGYTTGLLLPLERKSVEPMAARVEPARVGAAHQSLHHFVAKAEWSDAALLAAVRASVLPAIVGHGPIEAWIVDDTGMPKKGRHSVGVARQYCGQLGKQENCQVAVSLTVANAAASLPVAWRLYLPREWAEDVERRTKAGVPAELAFQTKPTQQTDGGAGADRSGPGGGHPGWRGPRRCRLWRGHEVSGAAGRTRAPVHRRRTAKSENLDQWQAAIAAQSLVGPNSVRSGPAALEPAP